MRRAESRGPMWPLGLQPAPRYLTLSSTLALALTLALTLALGLAPAPVAFYLHTEICCRVGCTIKVAASAVHIITATPTP